MLPTSPTQAIQSLWADALGLPTGLNCPQVGGLSDFICGGVSPIMDVGPAPCLTSAINQAIQAKNTFDAGRDRRLLVSTVTGAIFGAVSGYKFGAFSVLIPFVGPYVAVGVGATGAVLGAIGGGSAAFLKTAALDRARSAFITYTTFMGSWTNCQTATSPPPHLTKRPF
jgi:hypothetical protein